MPRLWGHADGLFREAQTVAGNLNGKIGVFARVEHIYAPGLHGDCAMREGGAMRLGINATGKARYHGDACFGAFRRQATGHAAAK